MITNIDIDKLKRIFIQKGEKISQVVTSVINWANISGKPSVFPPDSHAHVEADITDLGAYVTNGGLVGTKEVDETSIADEKILEYDAASGKLVYVNKPAGGGSGILNKLNATIAPDQDNDTTEGYAVGSLWIDITHGNIYQCVDPEATDAIWKQLNSVIVDDAPSDGNTYGRKDGVWAMMGSALEILSEFFIDDDPAETLANNITSEWTVA